MPPPLLAFEFTQFNFYRAELDIKRTQFLGDVRIEVSRQHLACGTCGLFLCQSAVFVEIGVSQFFHIRVGNLAQFKDVDNHSILWNAPHVQFQRPEMVVRFLPNGEAVARIEFKRDNHGCLQFSLILSFRICLSNG